MKEYIDADKLIETLIELQEIPTPGLAKVTNEAISLGLSLAVREVRKSPVADVEEVKYGKWQLARRGRKTVCSLCENPVPFRKDDKKMYHIAWYSKYCPNCGAKMSEIPTG